MRERILELGYDCKLVSTTWLNNISDLSLVYVEHSPDHYYSDTETDLEINEEKALEIIEFLKEHFDL